MLDAVPERIQAISRIRAAIAGALAGILAFMIWRYWAPLDLSQAGAVCLAGMSLVLSATAGFFAAMLMPLDKLDKTDVVSVTAGAGLRSGLIAALVCAGAILLSSVVKTFDAPSHAADLTLRALTWHTAFVLIAALFSSVPAGVVGSIAGLAVRMPHVAEQLILGMIRPGGPATNAADRPPTDGSIWLTRTLMAVSIAGMLSPLLLLLRNVTVDPPPAVVAPPPFRYVKPSGFDHAAPGQFVISARKTIPAAAADRPMLFSSDWQFFAYCPANSGRATVTVWNLDTFEEVASFSLSAPPNHLAWSPDLSRIFYLTQDSESRMGVLNLQTRSATELPQPKNRDMPVGQPAWWAPNHVAIFTTDEPPLALDLDTLLLCPLDESPALKSRDEPVKEEAKVAMTVIPTKPDKSIKEEPKAAMTIIPTKLDGWQMAAGSPPVKKKVMDPPRYEFPKREGWQMILDVAIQNVQPPPRKESSQPWNDGGFTALAFKEIGKTAVQWMPQIPIQAGDLVLPAPDGSKIVHHTGNQTEVIYFGTRENAPSVVSIKMPLAREEKKNDSNLAALMKQHALCAFAYDPMTNPLNGKTIGPDREHVRAILRVIKWDGDTAEFWAAEKFRDMQKGDVVADLHSWEGGRLTPATGIGDSKWWTSLAESPHADRDAIPSSAVAEDLDKGIELDVTRLTYAFQFQKASQTTHYAKPRVRAETPPAAATPPVLEAPKSMLIPSEPALPKDEIEKFVFEHHRKASEPDIFSLIKDYDTLVNYLGKYLTRDEIRQDELEYHEKWSLVTETPQRPITITKEFALFIANYTVKFRTESTSENRWVSGENDIVLTLKEVPKGFAIVKQTARIHDRLEGTLRKDHPKPVAVAPPKRGVTAPVTVNKPCWVSFFSMKGSNVDMTEALNLSNGIATLHRTVRGFDNSGKFMTECRAEFTGTYAKLGGNAIEVYPNQLKWGEGGDAGFINAIRANCEQLIGGKLQFDVSGDDLLMSVPALGGQNMIYRLHR